VEQITQAQALLAAGELSAAVAELTRAVEDGHADTTTRTFLFELLCFAGEWERAERELEILGQQSAAAEAGVLVYRNNIRAERRRARLFAEGVPPKFLSEPPAYVARILDAIDAIRAGQMDEARAALESVESERPALSGQFATARFDSFGDADDVTGPVLEMFVNDEYVWLPFEQVQRLEVAAPKRLRDLLWVGARVETAEATIGEVFLPALYVNSCAHPNEQVRLGRMTDWLPLGADLYAGAGLRLFFVDGAERTIFEARTVEFDVVIFDELSAANN
jgi:type VI secretion system protein ImpE